MPSTSSTFTFGRYRIDASNESIVFLYSLVHGDEAFSFEERMIVPGLSTGADSGLLKSVLDALHLMLGISYWKTFCPGIIDTGEIALTKDQAAFWNTLYTKGLGEFFYTNKIDFRRLVQFPVSKTTTPNPLKLPTQDKSLVGLGGGKDSIVSSELLKKNHKDFSLVSLDARDIHRRVAEIIGKPLIEVTREIDPNLYAVNRRGDVYNGHVPVSAIYAFVDLFLAVIGGYRYIVASNEESANYPNTQYLGEEINHQWSKTLEFETLFQRYVSDYITPDITYFSLLRPMKEIKIVELFSKLEQYFSSFSSCNANFFRHVETPRSLWCGTCPKCVFVFLLLSAFIPKDRLLTIFGMNLYARESLLPTFRELLGLTGVKPFDCVGTPEEGRFALHKASQSGQYDSDTCMQILHWEIGDQWNRLPALREKLFSLPQNHRIPTSFQKSLANL
ncbi:hypothetical protein HY339_03790 [Candidatus Gottesmanbacteria bacterium]|nr:hypothetical protein [Candidatus Gottesmanbacteria bacterium]